MERTGRLLTTLALIGALTAAPADAAKHKRVKHKGLSARLAVFDDCTELLTYARKAAIAHDGLVNAYYPMEMTTGGPTPATAPSASSPAEGGKGATDTTSDFSTTNNQEANVDEPDIVKTDGKRIFALGAGQLHALTVTDGKPVLKGSLPLTTENGDTSFGYGAELLLHGDRLLVMGTRYSWTAYEAYGGAPRARAALAPAYFAPSTSSAVIMEVDVSDPAAMKITKTMTIDGRYVSGRETGDTARIVVTTPPKPIQVEQWNDSADYEAKRKAAIANAPVSTFRPQVAFTKSGENKLSGALPCSRIRHPKMFSGLDTTTVLTIDLDKGLPAVDTDAILGAGDTVYASTSGLYVASQRWDQQFDQTGRPSFGTMTTQIHRFAAGERDSTTYRASGSVPGYLLNQFSLSEDHGFLRVATTEEPITFGDERTESSSALTVLDERDGVLVPVGKVGGLGHGERIYAVRMIGDVGYVVTFRQIDPLYTLDLSNPTNPRVVGELKILGYSAYLHPVGDDLLLGVGQDATEQGRRAGTQLSLFDVSDLRAPKLLHQAKLGTSSSSTVEYDHKAFLWWAPKRTVVIPVSIYDTTAKPAQTTTEPSGPSSPPAQPFTGVVGYKVTRSSGIDELGRMTEPDSGNGYSGYANRSLIFGGKLVMLSDRGVTVGSIDSISRTGFLAFPQPPQPEPKPGEPTPAR